jgi:hypothetical protein
MQIFINMGFYRNSVYPQNGTVDSFILFRGKTIKNPMLAIQLVVLVESVLLCNTLQDPPLRTSRKWLDLSLFARNFVSQIKNVT